MENIQAIMIFEIMGRPASYIKDALMQLIDKIQVEKGCALQSRKIFEPKLVEGQQDIFTTFAEIEIKFDKFEELIRIIFSYLPSHIDIISPQSSNMTNFEVNFMMNNLVASLHRYDEIAKKLMMENNSLKNYVQDLKNQQVVINQGFADNKDGENKKEEPAKKKRSYTRKKKEEKISQDKEMSKEKSAEESIEEKKDVEEPAEEKRDDEVTDIIEEGKYQEEPNEEKEDAGITERSIGGDEKDEDKLRSDDPEKIFEPEMTQEEEEYLDDINEALDDGEEKENEEEDK